MCRNQRILKDYFQINENEGPKNKNSQACITCLITYLQQKRNFFGQKVQYFMFEEITLSILYKFFEAFIFCFAKKRKKMRFHQLYEMTIDQEC